LFTRKLWRARPTPPHQRGHMMASRLRIDAQLRTQGYSLTHPTNPVQSLPALGIVPGSKHTRSPRRALRRAQGKVVVAAAVGRHGESKHSLTAMRRRACCLVAIVLAALRLASATAIAAPE